MRTFVLGILLSSSMLLIGCASGGESSQMTTEDVKFTVDKMADSLAGSEFLTGRTASSPPVVIVTNKVENLTQQIIPPAEQWMIISQLQTAMPIKQLAQSRNVRFVIPPERKDMAGSTGLEVADSGALTPTHALTAKFTSTVRTGNMKGGHMNSKQDYYYLNFQITPIQTREIVWSDAVEFKREAKGVLFD